MWNIHSARGGDSLANPRTHIHAIATVIRHARTDIACLQEVDRDRSDTGDVDQVRVLADETGLRRYVFGEMELRRPRSDGGRRGVAVISRLPLFAGRVVRLPGDENYASRPLLLVDAEAPTGERIVVACTHLAFSPSARESAAALAADRAARAGSARTILAQTAAYATGAVMGDFNEAGPPGTFHEILRGGFALAHQNSVDAIYARGSVAPPAVFAATVASPSSDHPPIVAMLPLRAR